MKTSGQLEPAYRLFTPVSEAWAAASRGGFPNSAAGTWKPEDTQGLRLTGLAALPKKKGKNS